MVKISVVMAYYNRKDQTLETLKSIESSEFKDFEVIIVDDASVESQRLEEYVGNYKYEIRLIRINPQEKTWVNPCVAYNAGIKESRGDIIMLQNPEVLHVGDCLSFVNDNLRVGDWLTFSCYGLGSFKDNIELSGTKNKYDYILRKQQELMYSRGDTFGGNAAFHDPQGWVNHITHRTACHYMAAIHKSDLVEKMDGGFYHGYKDGVCFDDNDFIFRLKHNNMKIKLVDFKVSTPFAVHQYHENVVSLNKKELWLKNQVVFFEQMRKINLIHPVIDQLSPNEITII